MPTASERIRALREAKAAKEARKRLGADEAKTALEGQRITSVEFVTPEGGPELDNGYVIIHVGKLTIYADEPSVYTDNA